MTPPVTATQESSTARDTSAAQDIPHVASNSAAKPSWYSLNKDLLSLQFQRWIDKLTDVTDDPYKIAQQMSAIEAQMDRPSALTDLCRRFGLSETECDILLLTALAEQSPERAKALQAHPLAIKGRASPALLEDLMGDAAIEALVPHGRLRQSGLIHLTETGRFYEHTLHVDEAVMMFLGGLPHLSERVAQIFRPAPIPRLTLGEATAIQLGQGYITAAQSSTIMHFHYQGDDSLGLIETLSATLLSVDVPVLRLNAHCLNDIGTDWHDWLKIAIRDLNLLEASLIISLPGTTLPSQNYGRLAALISRLQRPAYLIGALPADSTFTNLSPLCLPPTIPSQKQAIWQQAVSTMPNIDPQDIEATSLHFDLSTAQIRRSAQAVMTGSQPNLWAAARHEAGLSIGHLAKAITIRAGWDDLILPPAQSQALHQMAHFLTQRDRINNDWGFAQKSARGLGMAALFYGASGTGKTTAAEVLIQEMSGPNGEPIQLFRVDTASLVSKYIGETAKNLDAIFKAGAKAGAALLFDEAEGLFAKRTSGNRDSLDKHSNAELGFLLQCLEDYPGVAILTTNMRQLIDDAFLRRFRFVIEFPFPDRASRELIWRRAIPEQVPVATLDFMALARPSLSGGNIRSIVINAAYQAAADDTALSMAHIATALRYEFAKMDKPAPDQDIRKWAL